MFEGNDHTISEILLERRLLSPAQLVLVREEQRISGKALARAVLDLGFVRRDALLQAVAAHLGVTFIAELPASLPGELLPLVAGDLARNYAVAPLRADITSVTLLAADPFNGQIVADLAFALERDVQLAVADPERVLALVRQHYGDSEESLEIAAEDLAAQVDLGSNREELSDDDVAQLAGQTPIVRFVNLVLGRAIRDRASDVHFEPFEREFKIRYRVDGTLRELSPPPPALARPIISRLKVLANLNIAERRLPQDGRIRLNVAGSSVDMRVSTLPTQFGESVVLRVLDQSNVQLDITQLGMPPEIESGVRDVIKRPNGLFIVTGPTGSGKTTTLYSCLRLLNAADVKILTVEDPVEYEIDGIMQVPVNPVAQLTFARALRSFLRQDPDIVMVGEIRDLETAQIAVQAALTGHLVLTTLHTNDAPGAITRLVDMGVEPFLLASTVEAIVAQRLVRRICPDCRVSTSADTALLKSLGSAESGVNFHHGAGCPACSHTGYRGRKGIFEFLPMDAGLREAVASGASLMELRQKTQERGLATLRAAGLQALLAGETTAEEIAKYL